MMAHRKQQTQVKLGMRRTGGTVELATEEQVLNLLGLQGAEALVCRQVVVLDSVRRA